MARSSPPVGVPVTYLQQLIRCGKADCKRCASGPAHGPYWYAYWNDPRTGRKRSLYLGAAAPTKVAAAAAAPPRYIREPTPAAAAPPPPPEAQYIRAPTSPSDAKYTRAALDRAHPLVSLLERRGLHGLLLAEERPPLGSQRDRQAWLRARGGLVRRLYLTGRGLIEVPRAGGARVVGFPEAWERAAPVSLEVACERYGLGLGSIENALGMLARNGERLALRILTQLRAARPAPSGGSGPRRAKNLR